MKNAEFSIWGPISILGNFFFFENFGFVTFENRLSIFLSKVRPLTGFYQREHQAHFLNR